MNSLVALAFVCALVLMAGAADAGLFSPRYPVSPKGFLMKTVKVNGEERKYVVYVPPTYDRKKATSTILFLHGMGESGIDGLRQIAVGLGHTIQFSVDKWPFIVIMPQKKTPEIEWGDEDALVMAVLEQTRRELNVDKSRTYLTGLSMGGNGTWSVGAKHPELFAAIAPICGWGDKAMAEALAKIKMPTWIFHGDADDVVKPQSSIDMAEWMKAAGWEPKLTMYPGVGHGSWDRAYRDEDLAEWFLQYHRD